MHTVVPLFQCDGSCRQSNGKKERKRRRRVKIAEDSSEEEDGIPPRDEFSSRNSDASSEDGEDASKVSIQAVQILAPLL